MLRLVSKFHAHLFELERRFGFLSRATDVLVSGTSAGGVAAFLHASDVKAAVGARARVAAVPDSGFFSDHPAPPPDAPSPSTVYCRFCGAAAAANASNCTACGRPMGNAQGFVIDGKTAAIICRASVLATVALPVVAIFAPIILWGIHSNDQAIVREARAAINCHITMLVVSLVAFLIGVVGLVVFIGPIITALIFIALYIYAIVVGIRGLIAV
jgi:uncharacterized Tic20 family protein